jgi:hypothetical protein
VLSLEDRPFGPDVDVWINPGVRTVADGLLRDDGVAFPVSPDAGDILRHIHQPVPVSLVTARLARERGLPVSAVDARVQVFLRELQRHGLVSVSASHLVEGLARLIDVPARAFVMIVMRERLARPFRSSRGYPPTTVNILRAVLEAHQVSLWVFFLGGVVTVSTLAVISPLPADAAWYRAWMVLLICAGVAATFYGSAVAHEAAHLWMCRFMGARWIIVAVRRGAVSVTFRVDRRRRQKLIGLTGPIAGFLACAVMFASLVMAARANPVRVFADPVLLALMGAVATVAIGHVLALTPLSADGRLLFTRRR